MSKLDFLEIYAQARLTAFKSTTGSNSFATIGLIPRDPQRVIEKLDVQLASSSILVPTRPHQEHGNPKRPLNLTI